MKNNKKNNKYLFLIITLFFSLSILQACGTCPGKKKTTFSDGYYSVALTNNRVFFGKIVKQDRGYLHLSEAAYLVRNTPEETNNKNTPPKPNLALNRVSQDIQGPTDTMMISRKQVLYLQELRPDSQVVKAIEQLKTGPPQAAPAPAKPAS